MSTENVPKLTNKDLVEIFNVDRTTLYEWRKKGLPYYKLGGQVRYKEEEVLAWIENNRKVDTDK